MPNSRNSRFATFRSYILLMGGLAVIGWEVMVEQGDRPTIVIAALLMMGIAVPLNLDEKAKWLASLRNPPVTPPKDSVKAEVE